MVVGGKLRAWLQDHELASGLTACGHPLACAAGVAVIEAMRDERLVENAAAMGEVLGDGLRELAARHTCVGEVRGLGLLWALELVRRGPRGVAGRGNGGPTGRGDGGPAGQAVEPLVPYGAKGEAEQPMAAVRKAAMDLGLYLYTHDNIVLVAPPLVVTPDELDAGLAALDEALNVADAQGAGVGT
jgi:taurine--2-oxoglutarate transaminase